MALTPENMGEIGPRPRLAPELYEAFARLGCRLQPDCFSNMLEIAHAGSGGPAPTVSVIVTTSRNPSTLERCLRSILLCD
jgi:hypothetical protein